MAEKVMFVLVIVLACAGCGENSVYSNGGQPVLSNGSRTPIIISDEVFDERPLCFEDIGFGTQGPFRCVTVGHFREWARSVDAARFSSVPAAQEKR